MYSMGDITKASLKDITKVLAKMFIEDLSATFEDYEVLRLTADKAGLSLLNFYDLHKREPHHRYEVADFEDAQAAGAEPRLISHTITKEANMKISVKDSVFGKAARRLNDATVAEWNAATKAHRKPVGKSKSEADMRELAATAKYAETFEDPAVQKEFDDWARGVSMGNRDMTWMYAEPLTDGFEELDNKPEKDVDHYVSGNHYNDVVPGMEYMQMMQYMLNGKTGVEAHLFGQVYKYLMRAGKKDAYEQDIRKARWYTNCLVKFVQTGEIDVKNNDG